MLSRLWVSLKNSPKVDLGRWSLAKGNSVIINQTLASHDHCGCCGSPSDVKYEEILKSERKKMKQKCKS